MVRAEFVLESWKTIRQDTIAAVQDFPPGELDYRPVPELMTFGEIARHILDAGHALTGLLLAGDADLTGPDFRRRMAAHSTGLAAGADAQELAAALARSLEERSAALAALGPEYLAEIITRFDGQRVTRLEMLQMVKEHELTHRAQLFLYLRLKGIVPATTRRRLAKAQQG